MTVLATGEKIKADSFPTQKLSRLQILSNPQPVITVYIPNVRNIQLLWFTRINQRRICKNFILRVLTKKFRPGKYLRLLFACPFNANSPVGRDFPAKSAPAVTRASRPILVEKKGRIRRSPIPEEVAFSRRIAFFRIIQFKPAEIGKLSSTSACEKSGL